jgi:hypothetical protein
MCGSKIRLEASWWITLSIWRSSLVRLGYLVHVVIFYTNCQGESLYFANEGLGTLPALFHCLIHVKDGRFWYAWSLWDKNKRKSTIPVWSHTINRDPWNLFPPQASLDDMNFISSIFVWSVISLSGGKLWSGPFWAGAKNGRLVRILIRISHYPGYLDFAHRNYAPLRSLGEQCICAFPLGTEISN